MAKQKSIYAVILVLAIFSGTIWILPASLKPASAQANFATAADPVARPLQVDAFDQSASEAEGPEMVSVKPAQDTTTNLSLGNYALRVARRGHTATALPDGRVAIIGGQNPAGAVREVEILDPGAQSIKVVAVLRTPRLRHTATKLADGRVLVTGGWNQKDLFDSTEIFNPSTNSFSPGGRLARPRAAHTATVLADGRILLAGGRPDASAEIFDPQTNHTTVLQARMTAARSFHETILLADGKVLIVGGVDPSGQRLRSAEIFDTQTLRFSPTARPMRIKRVHPSLRILPDGKIQVIGGDFDGTMELYDPDKKQFRAAAHLTPTADIFPTSRVLQAQTRAAFIDSRIASEDKAMAATTASMAQDSSAGKQALDNFDQLLERSDYSSTEMPGTNRAVIAGGVGKNGEYVRSVVVMESSPATISTNKAEYLPGEQPQISGSGWQPNETIRLVRQETRPSHKRTYLQVRADERGNFITSDLSLADYQSGVTYTLTAMGESSLQAAQTTYQDARLSTDPKPEKASLNIPILFRDASFEHQDGLLVWEIRSGNPAAVRPPEMATQATAFEHTFSFDALADKPCFGICEVSPICPCPEGIDLRLKQGSSLTFSGSLDGDITADGAHLTVSEGVSGKFIIEVTLTGEHELPPIPIPGASIVFGVEIGDTGIGAEIALGIVARVNVVFNEPGTKFITTLNFSQSSSVGLSIDSTGVSPTWTGSISADIGFDLIETGGGCVKLSIGPELTASAGVDFKVCSVGVGAGVNVSPFIEACLNITDLNTCPKFHAPISIGLGGFAEASADFCIFSIGDDWDFELFRLPIFEFSGPLPEKVPPVIICPANVVAVAPQTCPVATSTVVNYPAPTVIDPCPKTMAVCTPASGSTFPVGTTTVTCTATDPSGNTAQCSFTVQLFNGCLQDDSNAANTVLFNTISGEYLFSANGVRYTGTGTVTARGCIFTIQQNTLTRRVTIQTDLTARRGSASMQTPPGIVKCLISDRDVTNNTCSVATGG